MTEIAFPLFGTTFVLLVVLPAVALIAKSGLVLLERDEAAGPLHGLDLRYLLLTSSSVLPLAWFFSAALHQAESGKSALACLLDHDATSFCFEPGFFAAALVAVVVWSGVSLARARRAVRNSSSDAAKLLRERLERILAGNPRLLGLRGRLEVTEAAGFALGTQGLTRPHVMVGVTFAAGISDEMLASALGHEFEHVRTFDPLRYLLLEFCLRVNPLGRLILERHAAHWRAAREAHCDRAAVIDGAAPLSLAEAIIRAARPATSQVVALGARDTVVLRLRVGMLLAFAEKTPHHCCRRESLAVPITLTLLALALLLPHQSGTAALDALHFGVEHTLASLWH